MIDLISHMFIALSFIAVNIVFPLCIILGAIVIILYALRTFTTLLIGEEAMNPEPVYIMILQLLFGCVMLPWVCVWLIYKAWRMKKNKGDE